MKKKLFLLLLLVITEKIFAQIQTGVYLGRDKNTNSPCKLFVQKIAYTDGSVAPENYFTDVLPRGYTHGVDSSGPFTLRTVADNSAILYSNQNYNEMVLFFENGDYLTGTPSGFNVKWLHGNHYHYDVCRSLKRKE